MDHSQASDKVMGGEISLMRVMFPTQPRMKWMSAPTVDGVYAVGMDDLDHFFAVDRWTDLILGY